MERPDFATTRGEARLTAGHAPRSRSRYPLLPASAWNSRRAVLSALGQKAVGDFPIIVVDDASPVPARDELKELLAGHPGRIRIVEQANGGPGAARNAGLADRLDAGTEYAAFLDSDDEWSEDHVSRALSALEQGFDFYFADYLRPDWKATHFKLRGLDPAAHPQIGEDPAVREFRGDFFDGILRSYYVGTPTVVYRFNSFRVRFPVEFECGEDHVFSLELARRTSRVVFSGALEVTCGEGVNIFAAGEWGSEAA